MSKHTSRWRSVALLHPFLFATMPILLLAAANVDQIELGLVPLPILISLACTSVLLLVLWLIFRDTRRTSAMASLLLLLFFSEGHLHRAIWDPDWMARSRDVHLVILLTFAAIAGVSWVWLKRTRRDLGPLTEGLAVASLALFAMSLGQICLEYEPADAGLPRHRAIPDRAGTGTAAGVSPLTEDGRKWPDIYYIILDGYARDDLLRAIDGFDNSEFTEYLQERGFYVAGRSCSNYPLSFLSLTSSLNMRYVNEDAQRVGRDRRDRRPFYRLLRNHEVGMTLQSRGYRHIHYNTSWSGTERSDTADVCLALPGKLPEFYALLAGTTMLQPLISRGYIPGMGARLAEAEDHLFMLESIAKTPGRFPGPTFSFAHVICPHPPYVFGRSGVIREAPRKEDLHGFTPCRNRKAYLDQLVFLNGKMREVVDSLIEDSPRKPIIIIQADHGSGFRYRDGQPVMQQMDFIRERMAILNAYYVPPEVQERLYPTITPVNTFRVIFDVLFGEDLPLLPDRQYMSSYDEPYDLVDVTDEME